MALGPGQVSGRSDIEPFLAMEVLIEAARLEDSGRKIVHMEVGQPGVPAPKAARDAAKHALDTKLIGYTESCGVVPLRERLSQHYLETYGLSVGRERFVVTTGSSAAFNLVFLAAFNPGDRILLTSPGYPAYRNIIKALGLVPVEVEVGPETRWSLTPDHIAGAMSDGPIHGVLVASPANPTGTMMTPQALDELVRFCEREGIWFISDEIYHGLVYQGQQETALKSSDRAIVINSFSKYFCMTGWRIGWMILPEELLRPVEKLAQSLFISPPELSQIAATAALDAKQELELVKDGYARNRAYLLSALPKIGFDALLPVDGAFYIYADTSKFSNDSLTFTKTMLNEAGVAATPGADFDKINGSRFTRFSFAGDYAEMEQAVECLGNWLR
jgi:aspartate/methionine/tyrosine aminotransferase